MGPAWSDASSRKDYSATSRHDTVDRTVTHVLHLTSEEPDRDEIEPGLPHGRSVFDGGGRSDCPCASGWPLANPVGEVKNDYDPVRIPVPQGVLRQCSS